MATANASGMQTLSQPKGLIPEPKNPYGSDLNPAIIAALRGGFGGGGMGMNFGGMNGPGLLHRPPPGGMPTQTSGFTNYNVPEGDPMRHSDPNGRLAPSTPGPAPRQYTPNYFAANSPPPQAPQPPPPSPGGPPMVTPGGPGPTSIPGGPPAMPVGAPGAGPAPVGMNSPMTPQMQLDIAKRLRGFGK